MGEPQGSERSSAPGASLGEIESWRCVACQFVADDARERSYNDACILCFERRLAAYGERFRPVRAPLDLRQDAMLLMLSALCWLVAATDACF